MQVSKIKVIKDFFGLREGDTTKDFMTEIKELSNDERIDLARGAAQNLGIKPEDCDFPMED